MGESFFIIIFLILVAGVLGLAGLAFNLRRNVFLKEEEIIKEREESTRRLYEVYILKEIGERAGYSLDVEKILQIITGSLRQFIDYSAVSYIVVLPNKLKINTHLEKSVDHTFLKDLKDRMVASLSALSMKNFDGVPVEETVSGAIVVDTIAQPIGSFFNIPLVIGGNLAGILTVAHVEKGLYKEADMTILYKITGQASEAVSRLEEVVEIEKRKLNAMVESMGDGVLMVDEEYRIVVSNPAVKKLISFNPPPGQERDITIFDFIEGLGGKFDIRGRLEEAIVKGSTHNSPRKQIGETYFEVGVYPVKHALAGSEKIFGAVVVFHDITEEIELEKVREEFTSMIVHELRSPLDGAKKILELIAIGKVKETSKEFDEYIKMVYQSSTSMLELVNDILDYSKIQAGKFEIHKEEASLPETIENRVEFYKVSADTKKISLEAFIDPSTPPISHFDTSSVKQVLNNFISNALKFTKEGGSIEIISFLLEPGTIPSSDLKEKMNSLPIEVDLNIFNIKTKSVAVLVSDTGIGIPKEKIKELFSKYSQAGRILIYSEDKGTGLGLVIAKGIVESHGGSVGALSAEQKGSVFYFTLPV